QTDAFLSRLASVRTSIAEWRRQREIYLHASSHSLLDVGFSTFFLNRCNRSGIIANAGPIGGFDQRGKWKIDARFNRDELSLRIDRTAKYLDRSRLSKLDAITFTRKLIEDPTRADRGFVYLDPPYFEKGSQLYMNHYVEDDHAELANLMKQPMPFKWIISYDN